MDAVTEFLLFEALLELAEAESLLDEIRTHVRRAPLIPADVQERMNAFKSFRDD